MNDISSSFDCFISYSRRDTRFARRLHAALSRYKPPRGIGEHRRTLRVFFDTSDITGTDYHEAIEGHLANAGKMLLVCSPDAAGSEYVDDEVERFVRLRGPGNVVPILARGLPNNEATADQTGERAFPPALTRALAMPLAADFRQYDPAAARIDTDENRDAWMMLLANLLGVSRAEIEQRELQRRRRRRRVWMTATSIAFAVLLSLTLWALYEGERALARQLTAQASVDSALVADEVERRVLVAREAALRLSRLREETRAADMALRDALNRLPRRVLSLAPGQRAVAFTGDGGFLIASESAELIVHSLATGRVSRRIEIARPPEQLAASADLRHVAGLDREGRLLIWSWPGFAAVTGLPPALAEAPLSCIAFSGDKLVALRMLDDGRAFELMSWRTGEPQLRERASARSIAGAVRPAPGPLCLRERAGTAAGGLLEVAEPAGENPGYLAWHWPLSRPQYDTSGADEPLPIRQWDGVAEYALGGGGAPVLVTTNGRLLRPTTVGAEANVMRGGRVLSQLSSDGGLAVSLHTGDDMFVPGLKPTRIEFVDTANGEVERSIGDFTRRGAFTPDAETYVTYLGTRIRLWDRRSGAERLRLTAGFTVTRLEFDRRSRFLAAHADNGAVEVFHIGAADEVLRAAAGDMVSLSPADTVLGTGGRILVRRDAGALPLAFEADGYLHAVDSAPGGRYLVAGVADNEPIVKIGEPPGLEFLLLERGDDSIALRYRGPWGAYRFDATAARLLVVGNDGEVRMIQTRSGDTAWSRAIENMVAPAAAGLRGWRAPLAFASDGSVAAVPTADGILLLDGGDGHNMHEVPIEPTALALSADGRLLARNGDEGSVVVQRTADGAVVARFDGADAGDLRDLMFSANGTLLLGIGGTEFSTFMSGGHYTEERAVLWDLRRGVRVAFIPASTVSLEDYQDRVGAAGDEAQLLSSMVWNTYTGEFAGRRFASLLTYWTVPADEVTTELVAWRLTNDGVRESYRAVTSESLMPAALPPSPGSLVVKDGHGNFRALRYDHEHLINVGCAALPHSLAGDERDRLLPGLRTSMECPGE